MSHAGSGAAADGRFPGVQRVGVPAGPEAADVSAPDESATHIVFDLLPETLYERGCVDPGD